MFNHRIETYQQLTLADRRWLVHEDFVESESFKTLARLPTNFMPAEEQMVQKRRGHVSWFFQEPGLAGRLFVKKYYPRNRINRVQYAFRRNRAVNEFSANFRFRQLGLSVSKMLALGEHKTAGFWHNSLLISQGYSNCTTLKDIDWAQESIEQLIEPFARDIARLHDNGIYFGDLHSGNVLVVSENQSQYCLLTDLDKVKFYRNLPDRLWVDDLARLNGHIDSTNPQRMQFFRKYCHYRKLSNIHTWYLRVNDRTEYLWKKYQRKHGVDVRKYML